MRLQLVQDFYLQQYSYELVALTNISIGIWILGKPRDPCEPWRMQAMRLIETIAVMRVAGII